MIDCAERDTFPEMNGDIYQWMGFEARDLIFDFLDEAVKDHGTMRWCSTRPRWPTSMVASSIRRSPIPTASRPTISPVRGISSAKRTNRRFELPSHHTSRLTYL